MSSHINWKTTPCAIDDIYKQMHVDTEPETKVVVKTLLIGCSALCLLVVLKRALTLKGPWWGIFSILNIFIEWSKDFGTQENCCFQLAPYKPIGICSLTESRFGWYYCSLPDYLTYYSVIVCLLWPVHSTGVVLLSLLLVLTRSITHWSYTGD